MVGNPNHDARTGRFTSSSGLNKSNSTMGQRGKAKVKEHISAAKAAAIGTAAAVVGAAGAAVLQGISRPIRYKGAQLSHQLIAAAEVHAKHLVATHGPKIAKAVAAKGSTLVAHVKNMKLAGKSQHNVSSVSSRTSSFKSSSQLKAETSAVLNRARTKQTVRVKAPSRKY